MDVSAAVRTDVILPVNLIICYNHLP